MNRRNFLFAAAAVAAASQFRWVERLSTDKTQASDLAVQGFDVVNKGLSEASYSEHLNWVFDDPETPVPFRSLNRVSASDPSKAVQVPFAGEPNLTKQLGTQPAAQLSSNLDSHRASQSPLSSRVDELIEDGINHQSDHSRALDETPKATEVAKSIVEKVKNFSINYADDVFLSQSDQVLLDSTLNRLARLQNVTGFGNFNILGFDEALKFAKSFSDVGEFTAQELAFIEQIFTTDARNYGFFGEKVSSQLTDVISKDSVIKVPGSGHYLFKEQSLHHYDQLVRDVGEDIVLTSGIRANVKQLHLFLAKARSVNYNLSRASRSLAPPGHSFHGIGDYDVGKMGMGAANFTDAFADSDVFKRMADLGYIQIRYMQENTLGVRFEPWHIKVV